ncbi:metal ABC transporter ATP-binding protein [Actinocorallia sp. API 0066]|uniref:metal ABC transporter ATP-binding protein n=1 Tax=Actinocorallia sp. API 0066 TaxID=2896846 RepID=UPI001E59CD49|nr:metal ABC transporter ATP-binding protein [Actinocorallia sp. API 0066]MCD0451118.1 metal ABC transporter ATP-binding protein [Actinocorallia sp. API 0066]
MTVETAPAPVPVFRLRGARVRLGGREVLHGIDLDVAPGEVVALMGPNGSGKSTLVRALLGLVPLAGGEREVFGARRPRDFGRLGYVPQRLSVGGGVPATVREVVSSGRIARRPRWRPSGAADRRAVAAALDALDLTPLAGRNASGLSGGQQQRVLIARALAGEPDVIVMDEPLAGVDAASQEALAGTLARLVADGVTVLLVLHELGPLAPLITRSVVLEHGAIVHEGTPPEPSGDCAAPGHDHVHPHAAPTTASLWDGGYPVQKD